jgi:ribosomal protein S18 acetylase RimI-like enzyme
VEPTLDTEPPAERPHVRDRPDLAALAAIAERCQADPQRYCAYTGDDLDSIASDVAEVLAGDHHLEIDRAEVDGHDGADDRGEPAVRGWLLAEIDREIDRIWWWGPFVDDGADWDTVADRLYARAAPAAAATGEELAADARSGLVAGFATRHGFDAQEGSACLVVRPDALRPDALRPGDSRPVGGPPVDVPVEIVALGPAHHDAIAALHEQLFAGSHTTGRGLVDPNADPTRAPRLVATIDGRAVGYVAAEHQHDGSLYVDFVGVTPDNVRRGIGRALVAAACRAGFEQGATFAHLTVRTSNVAARALYRSLGFDEERVLAPYRRNIA